jgi:hypothetical protein
LKKPRIKFIIAIQFFLLILVMLPFQNCSQQLKVSSADSSNINNAASSVPTITFDSNYQLINQNSLTTNFNFSGGEILSVSCALDSGAPQNCLSKSVTYSNLVDGDHFIEVTAINTIGEEATARKSFRKDSTPPVISVAMTPQALSSESSTAFIFSVMDNLSGVASTQCSLDNSAFSLCVSPMTLSGLALGNHNYKIRATDLAGNLSLVYSFNWQIDQGSISSVSIQSLPPAISNLTAISLAFTGRNVVSYECRLNAAAYAGCGSPQNYNGLTNGSHTFRVRGVTPEGVRTTEAITSWTVDLVAPTTPQITSNIPAVTNQTSASIIFSATDSNGIASYQCSLNSANFSLCTSPVAVSGLTNGSHNIRVQARDSAGNISALGQYNWTIENAGTGNPSSQANVFIAAGHMGRTVISCDDGMTWIRDRSDNDNTRCWVDGNPNYVECDHTVSSFTGLDFGGGWFYTQFGWGSNGTVRRSRDGNTWETIRSNGWGGGLAYTNNTLVSLFTDRWAYSLNQGSQFQDVAVNSNAFELPFIYKTGQRFFARGRSGGSQVLAVSENGVAWRNSANFQSDWGNQGFAEGNGVIVGHGQSTDVGHIVRSTDNGNTWTRTQAFTGSDRKWASKILFNGTHFINWSQGQMWKSQNGISWTQSQVIVNGQAVPDWWEVSSSYNPRTGTYIAITTNWGANYGDQKAYRSTNGESWNQLTSTKFKGGHPIGKIINADVDASVCP